jgi:hypothetical protein
MQTFAPMRTVECNPVGKPARQGPDLSERVGRLGVMARLQDSLNQRPSSLPVVATGDMNACPPRTRQGVPPPAGKRRTARQIYRMRQIAANNERTTLKQRVEIILRGLPVEDVRHRSHAKFAPSISTQSSAQDFYDLQGLAGSNRAIEYQPTEGEPTMGNENRRTYLIQAVRGQQCQRLVPPPDHPRYIGEAVSVVLEVITFKQKYAVPGLTSQRIPGLPVGGFVASNL